MERKKHIYFKIDEKSCGNGQNQNLFLFLFFMIGHRAEGLFARGSGGTADPLGKSQEFLDHKIWQFHMFTFHTEYLTHLTPPHPKKMIEKMQKIKFSKLRPLFDQNGGHHELNLEKRPNMYWFMLMFEPSRRIL